MDSISQIPPDIIEKMKVLVDVHDNKVLNNKIDLRDFWQSENYGNLHDLLRKLTLNAVDYGIPKPEKNLISRMLADIPDKLAILDDSTKDDNTKAENRREIRDDYKKFIDEFCRERIKQADKFIPQDNFQTSKLNETLNQNNRTMRLIMNFYDILSSMYYLKSAVDHLLWQDSNEEILKVLAIDYKRSASKFKADYYTFIVDLEEDLPSTWVKIEHVNNDLKRLIDKLIKDLNAIRVSKGEIIQEIVSDMDNIEHLFKLLYEETFQNLLRKP